MKERIITGVILGLIVLWAIFRLSDTIFDTAVAIILLFAAWEWAAFANAKTLPKRILYLVVTLVLIYLSQFFRLPVLVLSCVFWFFAFYLKSIEATRTVLYKAF